VIAVIDNGGANMTSLLAALRRLGAEVRVTADPHSIRRAAHVILPGVGAAADSMARLRNNGLAALIPTLRQPLLGICLGMQLLFESSEEGPSDCLGLLRGTVTRLRPSAMRRVPHAGWSRVRWLEPCALGAGLDGGDSWFYFMHGYAVRDSGETVGTAGDDDAFAAVVSRGNFAGVQFHPERSGPAGARLLENFLEMR
jgi:glutamine amidotransferase